MNQSDAIRNSLNIVMFREFRGFISAFRLIDLALALSIHGPPDKIEDADNPAHPKSATRPSRMISPEPTVTGFVAHQRPDRSARIVRTTHAMGTHASIHP